MTENKLVKTIMDAAALTGFAAAFEWGLKKWRKRISTPTPAAAR